MPMAARDDAPGRLTFGRRRMLQLMAAASAVALHPRLLTRIAVAAPSPALPPHGFLNAEELAILDAAMAQILPTDGRLGAREIGVVDYVQGLLSFMPGSDANCDRRVNAADIVAIVQKSNGEDAGCAAGGDVDGDANADEADVVAAEAAVFRARPTIAGGPFSARQPQSHFPIDMPCHFCHGAVELPSGLAAGGGSGNVDLYPPNAFREFVPLTRLQLLSWKIRILGTRAVPQIADNPLLAPLL